MNLWHKIDAWIKSLFAPKPTCSETPFSKVTMKADYYEGDFGRVAVIPINWEAEAKRPTPAYRTKKPRSRPTKSTRKPKR